MCRFVFLCSPGPIICHSLKAAELQRLERPLTICLQGGGSPRITSNPVKGNMWSVTWPCGIAGSGLGTVCFYTIHKRDTGLFYLLSLDIFFVNKSSFRILLTVIFLPMTETVGQT